MPVREPKVPRHDARAEAPLTPDRHCDAAALAEALGGDVEVEWVASTNSTNADLLARARMAPAAAPAALRVADAQEAGRGRMGRRWHSAPGATLTFSFATTLARGDLAGLSLAAGVAIADALESMGSHRLEPLRIALKWPNDLCLVEAAGELAELPWRKLGGILIETAPAAGGRLAVIGVGLNLTPLPDGQGLPFEVASLDERHAGATALSTLVAIAPALRTAVAAFEHDGLDHTLRTRFAARDLLAGRAIRAGHPQPRPGQSSVDGTGAGIGCDGALLIRDPAGRLVSVSSGAISVRAASAGAWSHSC